MNERTSSRMRCDGVSMDGSRTESMRARGVRSKDDADENGVRTARSNTVNSILDLKSTALGAPGPRETINATAVAVARGR